MANAEESCKRYTHVVDKGNNCLRIPRTHEQPWIRRGLTPPSIQAEASHTKRKAQLRATNVGGMRRISGGTSTRPGPLPVVLTCIPFTEIRSYEDVHRIASCRACLLDRTCSAGASESAGVDPCRHHSAARERIPWPGRDLRSARYESRRKTQSG